MLKAEAQNRPNGRWAAGAGGARHLLVPAPGRCDRGASAVTTLLLSLTLSASKARQLHVGLRGGSSTRERVGHPWHRPHPRPAVPWASEITSLPPPTTFLEPGAAAQALQPQDPREVRQLWVGPVERLAGSIAFSPDRGEKGFPSPAGPQIHQDSRPSKPQAPSPRGRLGGAPTQSGGVKRHSHHLLGC